MNIFDIVILLLILLSGVMGLKKGAIKEIVVCVGTILVYIIAFVLRHPIGYLFCKWFPFFSYDGIPTLNILVYQLIAFILVASLLFTIATVIFKITGIVQKLVDLSIIFTIPSKILGFIVGVIEGYILMFIILIILMIPLRSNDLFQDSTLVNKIVYNSPILTKTLGKVPDAIGNIITITMKVDNNSDNDNKNQLNLDIIKVELDCNIITQDEALELINKGKLDDVDGIKSTVLNYEKN